jgi:hypothetical protein
MSVQYGIEYNGVRFLPDRIELLGGGSPIASVKKEDVRHITARYMLQAERPLLQLIIGGVLLFFLLVLLYNIVLWHLYGGVLDAWTVYLTVIPGGLGGYLTWQALKRSHLLLVELDHTKRKFPFNKKVDQELLLRFLSEAGKMGYDVDLASVYALFQSN